MQIQTFWANNQMWFWLHSNSVISSYSFSTSLPFNYSFIRNPTHADGLAHKEQLDEGIQINFKGLQSIIGFC